jgi:hydrophobic/amphiphilic exporter-1 (mainly G- bacteria), HAE1 family
MMMLALVVLGVVSYGRLAIDEYPDVTYPTINVSVSYAGASPEVMMRQVSKPLEEALNTVQGIKEINSSSSQGRSNVRVTFNLGVDIGIAQQDVQAKVSRIRRSLPPLIDEPVIQHFDPNDSPIMSIAMQSNERGIRELTDLAVEVVSIRLEAIQGVGGVNVNGGNQRQIKVQLDPDAMRAYNVSPVQVSQALARENQEVPAGRVSRGATEQLVSISGRIVDPKAFGDIAVSVRNGVPVKLSDVATIIDGAEERRSMAEIAGKGEEPSPTVSLDVLKISESNTVAVADSVRGVMRELQDHVLPRDVKLTVIRDQSTKIRAALDDVQLTIILGAVLTILIIYLFLNSWRSTVITGLTLPVSIISAFFIMWAFNFTLNTMTLLALSLAIGLLIDDAIVVRENIVRHLEMGKDHYKAAKEGTDEIGLAVAATSLAVVAVFFPVAFMGGMIGRIFMQFGVTVAFAVLVSLFVSFTLDPMLSSIWPDPDVEGGQSHGHGTVTTKNPIRRFAFAFNAWFERVADHYPSWLRWSLKHRFVPVGVAAASIVGAFAIIPKLGFTWMPDADTGEMTVGFRTPPGSSLAYTFGKGREIADFLRKQPEVVFTHLSVGGGGGGGPGGGGVNNGNVYVRLLPKKDRRSLFDIQQDLRAKLRTLPNVRPTIQGQMSIFGGRGQPIRINVQGPEVSRLKIAAANVLEAVRQVPGVAEPNSSDDGLIPQLDVRVDRQEAWRAGLNIGSIGATLSPLFAGQRATRWEDPIGFEHDVMVMYPDSMRTSAADVANIVIPTTNVTPGTSAAMIPLSQVAEIRAGVGPQQIDRRNLEQQVSINSGVLPGMPMGDVANDVRKAINQVGLPPGYHFVFGGDVQNLDETKGYVLEALLLAVVFIYLILASLFGSFLQPLAIMIALPLSFIGVALALLVTKGSISVMAMIGIIMLMGLVTKNGILLIDFTNQQREAGNERTEALLAAGRIRLRPIIMTTVAMIFGMIPLALAIGEGAEQRAPMARAVIGGLITSTFLTLFVVPVVYTLLDDAAAFAMGRSRKPSAAHGTPVPGPVAGD